MSAEEADKTTTTDASAGDEEEEWLYGGKKKKNKQTNNKPKHLLVRKHNFSWLTEAWMNKAGALIMNR